MDIDCIENNIEKELGIYKDGKTVRYSFLSRKIFNATAQFFWCTKHFHRTNWRSGYNKNTDFEKTSKSLQVSET